MQEKPHKCSLCAKSFPTPGDLKAHMYVHTGTWPYRCPICTRGFSKQTNLKNHLHLHENGGLEADAVPEDLEDGDEDLEDIETEDTKDPKDARMGMRPLSEFLLQMVNSARGREANSTSSGPANSSRCLENSGRDRAESSTHSLENSTRGLMDSSDAHGVSSSPVSSDGESIGERGSSTRVPVVGGLSNLFRPINM